MEAAQSFKKFSDDQLQNLINNLSKCKLEYTNCKEECKRLGEAKMKLEIELKEAVELEKSHRCHLLTSREIIGNLQETVTQLLYIKGEVKNLKNEIISKDLIISSMEKDKENNLRQCTTNMNDMRKQHETEIEELKSTHEKKDQQVQYEFETQIAERSCLIEELRWKMNEMDTEHKEKVNMVVLEYEEKIQRSAAQMAHLQEQLERQTSHTDANIEAYRRKLEDLEEKLKQSQFKEYLAQSKNPSQYENRVERPYSENRHYSEYTDNRVLQSPGTKNRHIYADKIQTSKPVQAMYRENNIPKTNDNKGYFKITKKRKLYTEKGFMN